MECVICLGLVPSTTFRSLPCHHQFHTSCLRQWITSQPHATCPLCRGPLYETVDLDPEGDPAMIWLRHRLDQFPWMSDEDIKAILHQTQCTAPPSWVCWKRCAFCDSSAIVRKGHDGVFRPLPHEATAAAAAPFDRQTLRCSHHRYH